MYVYEGGEAVLVDWTEYISVKNKSNIFASQKNKSFCLTYSIRNRYIQESRNRENFF
jgi:hypothetical protein